ncbi:MAG: hypothetical protein GY749_24045 [Desulfobacteraceae bacterium]|nr:hypothetical protein [Desulfobacteraceae bacterium]
MINPFRDKIVKDPWNPGKADVQEINADAFDLCCKTLETVRTAGQSTSVLLYGEAGNGKTHLLGRVREHLEKVPELHIFISVRLQTSPRMFWQHVRKSFAESLTRNTGNNKSQLELICLNRLPCEPHLEKRKYIPVPMFLERLEQKTGLLQRLEKLIERLSHKQTSSPEVWKSLAAQANISPNLCKALERYLTEHHRQEAVAWLKGDSLPESALSRLNLASDNNDKEYQSREIVKELCRLAGSEIPVVLCFDQIEALQRYPGDIEGVFVFGQAVRTLHDETDNVLMISCLQSYFQVELGKVVTAPDYAALAAHEKTLNSFSYEQSVKLVQARLEVCGKLSEEKKEELGPAFEKELQEFIKPEGQTARQILEYCANLFDLWETGESEPEISDDDFLNEQITKREKQAIQNITPGNTDGIIRSALPILANLTDENWKEHYIDLPRDVDMVLKGSEMRLEISLCNEDKMQTLTSRFKRLLDKSKEDETGNLIIMRHPELKISSGSSKGRECFEKLKKQKNVRVIYPDNQILAALDAMQSLIADARSGDLSSGGKNISADKVREWLKNHLAVSAQNFLDEIMGMQGG